MAFRALTPFGWGAGVPGRTRQDDPFFGLRRDMDRLFDDFFRGTGLARPDEGQTMMPRIDVSETDKAIEICAELPGVAEKDIEVQLNGDMLTIRGEKKSEREEGGKDKSYHVVERSYGSFARSIQLPFNTDPNKVQASFDKGVLTITLPKPQETQQSSKRIEVKSSGASSGKAGASSQEQSTKSKESKG
jgi:HSP20 family protein